MNSELEQLQHAIKVQYRCLEVFRATITRGTGSELAVKRAADRIEEALIDCLRKATEELAGHGTRADSPNVFDCSFCGGEHQLLRDVAVLNEAERFDHIPLMRELRYGYEHACVAVRELKDRGLIKSPDDDPVRMFLEGVAELDPLLQGAQA